VEEVNRVGQRTYGLLERGYEEQRGVNEGQKKANSQMMGKLNSFEKNVFNGVRGLHRKIDKRGDEARDAAKKLNEEFANRMANLKRH